MRDIFYELIKEAKDARVSIDGDEWPIGFNSNIEGEYIGNKRNLSTLVIENKEEFFSYLEKYINKELELNRRYMYFSDNEERNHIKALMTYLFANMSTEDFIHPVNCLRRRIAYLEDSTFSLFDEEIDFKPIPDSKLIIKQSIQSIYMETPYIIDMFIERNGSIIQLPYISYGICEENGEKVCYIYSIMNHPAKKNFVIDEQLAKKVNRIMFKMNKGVVEDESREYGELEDSIINVTPSFAFVHVTFLTMLQSKGINKVKAVPYLPVRYLSRAVAAEKAEDPNIRKQREDRNNQIQRNATDKFIRTFRRAAYHMEGAEIIGYPYEFDENLTMELHGREVNNELLQDVSDQVMGR